MGNISATEFRKVLQEVEKYRKFKADIGNQTKAMVKQIEKEQREEIFEQRRKKEEKKTRKIFHGKSQTLQVPRVPMPCKI